MFLALIEAKERDCPLLLPSRRRDVLHLVVEIMIDFFSPQTPRLEGPWKFYLLLPPTFRQVPSPSKKKKNINKTWKHPVRSRRESIINPDLHGQRDWPEPFKGLGERQERGPSEDALPSHAALSRGAYALSLR